MVGGYIIQIEQLDPSVWEFWVVDGTDEMKVRVKDPERLPDVGTECWWQAGKVYCEGDTLVLNKFANAHSA